MSRKELHVWLLSAEGSECRSTSSSRPRCNAAVEGKRGAQGYA